MNYEKEMYLADVMSTNIDKGPGEMGVPQRLCMEDQVRVVLLYNHETNCRFSALLIVTVYCHF